MSGAIQDVADCYNVCLETITHSLEKGGKHASVEHLLILIDCADICKLTERSMRLGSPVHQVLCDTCALICEECAKHCESLGGKEMEECAASCRKCAESCRSMAE